MKKKFFTICGLIVMVLAVSTLGYADDFFYTVTPIDLADGPTFANGQGGVPFGFDPDSVKPIGISGNYPADFADGCFWSDVQGSVDGGGTDYTAIRLSPKDIFGVSDVTIGQLSEISYYTKWLSDLDWQLKIYTESTVKWYGYRFNFTRPGFVDNAWNHSSTDTNLIVSDIFDKEVSGYVTVPGSGELSDLYNEYGDKKILFIDIISSYMTTSPPGDSFLDGIVIELMNADVATMNLEAAVFTCVGFEPPMDNGTVKVKKNRVLPLKAEIMDSSGNPVTDAVIGQYPPIVQATKKAGDNYAIPVNSDDFLPTGHGTEGNEFIFDGVKWFYNLGTKGFTSTGEYEIIMRSPDEGLYIIERDYNPKKGYTRNRY